MQTRTRGTILFSLYSVSRARARARNWTKTREKKICNWTLASLAAPVRQTYTYLSFEKRKNWFSPAPHFLLVASFYLWSVRYWYGTQRFTSNGISFDAHGNRNKKNYNVLLSISNYRNHLFIRYWIYVPGFFLFYVFSSVLRSPIFVFYSIRFVCHSWLLLLLFS